MARIGIETVKAFSKDRKDSFEVKFTMNVNAIGEFTTTLNPQDAEKIKSLGISLCCNSKFKPGFFSSTTKQGLLSDILSTLEQCLSRELIDERIIIRYAFATMCSYGLTVDGVIIPNLGFTDDGKPDMEKHWQSGNINTHAANRKPTGVLFWVRPFVKKSYKYKSGKIRTEYIETSAFGSSCYGKAEYHLRWLEAICSTVKPREGEQHEIDYTEDRAKFFVETYKSLCKLSDMFSLLSEPENVIAIAENGKCLMQ